MSLGYVVGSISEEAKTNLQVILNALAEGICAIDNAGNGMFCNDAFLAMTGYTSEEMIGRNVHGLVHHSYPDGTPYPASKCPMLKMLGSGQSIAMRSDTLWRKDGRPLPVNYSVRALSQQTDGTACVVTISDLTDWERSAAALRSSEENIRRNEEKFSRILNNLPDVAWTGDQNGRITYMSPRIEELTGFSAEDIYAGGVDQLFARTHRYDASGLRAALEELFARRQPFDKEFRYQRKDGEWVWLQSRSLGAYEQDGIVLADGMICEPRRHFLRPRPTRASTASWWWMCEGGGFCRTSG